MPSSIASAAVELQRWAHSFVLSSSLTVSLAHGFAVTASQPIGEGEVLLRVPQRLVLSADGAVAALPGILDRATEAHVSLAAWLMQLTERPPRPLRSYLASLSAAEIDCTLLWRPDELGLLGQEQTAPLDFF